MRRRKGPSPGRNQRPAQALPTRATPSPKTPFEREQTTKRRGEISELAFALAAARQGFGISRPYGDSERYDIILDCPKNDPSHLNPSCGQERPRLIRVQVKATTQVVEGLYRVNAHRRINGTAVPYKLSEIDFIAAYIIPEDSWFILPLAHILGQTSLLLRPRKSRRPCPYAHYREAWHLLRQPDGLEFA
jgi:PD-(D/E)XK endonuclease